MSAEDPRSRTYARHMKAKDDGKTCSDCHKGIAHPLSKGYVVEDDS